MEQTLIPPKVPQYWVSYALDMEQKLRQRMGLHVVVRIKTTPAKVEAFFGSSPPWEVLLEIEVNGLRVWAKSRQFTGGDGGAVEYDRTLKQLFQALNDDIIIEAIEKWYHNKL